MVGRDRWQEDNGQTEGREGCKWEIDVQQPFFGVGDGNGKGQRIWMGRGRKVGELDGNKV